MRPAVRTSVGLPTDARSRSGCSYRRLASNCFSAAALLLLGLVWLRVDPKPDAVVRPATAVAARPIPGLTRVQIAAKTAAPGDPRSVLSRVSGPATAVAARPTGLVTLAAPPLDDPLQAARSPLLSRVSGAPRDGGGGGGGGGGGDQGGGGSGGDPHPPPAGGCQPLGPSLVHAAAASNALGLLLVTFVNSAQVDYALHDTTHCRCLLRTSHCELLTAHFSLLATHYSLFATLTSHCSLLTAR